MTFSKNKRNNKTNNEIKLAKLKKGNKRKDPIYTQYIKQLDINMIFNNMKQ